MKTLFILYTLLSAFLPSIAEETLERRRSNNLSHQEMLPPESVQLQLSEEVVMTGETIWFQGMVSGADGSEGSKVLYVEVLNSREAVVQGIYSINKGIARGQIHLPDTLSGGWYQVRAYTQWMRNFGKAAFWSQAIMVVNPYEDNISVQEPITSGQSAKIQFFPEGGNFVEDLPNRLWIQLSEEKATDSLLSAKLVSPQDSVPLADVQFESGRGLLSITPEFGKDYELEVYFTNGDTLREALPKSQPLGTSVQAQFEQNSLKIDTYHSKRETYTVVLRTHDKLLYTQEYRDDSFSFQIAIEDLPGGIMELSVLDKEDQQLAQRMLHHASSEGNLQITLDKNTYLPREAVSANIKLEGVDNSAQVAVTVRKVNPLTEVIHRYKHTFGLIDQRDMLESPDEVERTKWINRALIVKESPFGPLENEVETQTMRYNREDESLTVSGKVEGLNGEVAGMVAVLSVPGTNPYFEYDFVNEDGSFQIPVKEDVLGKKDVVLQMADTSLQVRWTLDKKFLQENTYSHMHLPAVPDQALKEILQYYSRRSQIKSQYDVFAVQDTVSGQSEKKFRFYGAPNFEINLDNYIALPNFVEVNRELMPGVRLRENKGNYNFDVFDIPSRTFLTGEPAVFLDGVLVHDLSYIINFPPDEIAFIETVNRRTYYGEYRFDGTIAIYSREGDAYLPTLSSSAKKEQASMYTAYQTFSKPDTLQTHEPDFSTLLHWQSSVQLSNEPVKLDFNNADELGEFEIIVKGMTEDGQSIYGRKTYTVSLTDLP